jgi:hypothetical protein
MAAGQSLMLDEDSPTFSSCVKLGSIAQGAHLLDNIAASSL